MSKSISLVLTTIAFAAVHIVKAEASPSADELLRAICNRATVSGDKQTQHDCRQFFGVQPQTQSQKVTTTTTIERAMRPAADAQAAIHPAPTVQDQPSESALKRLFIRADSIDNFWYSLAPPGAGLTGVQGASVSYTDDRLAGTQSATINGRISYLLVPPNVSDLDQGHEYALAGWISGDGTWKQPLKLPENTALKVGADSQLRIISDDLFAPGRHWDGYFGFSPYLLTDFRGLERAGGLNFNWEPVIPELHLGAGKTTGFVQAFWNFRPEFDLRDVSDPGVTSQKKGLYEWLGYQARGTVLLLPLPTGNAWIDRWLVNRFTLIGGAQYYWDIRSMMDVRSYTAQLQYNLGLCGFDSPGMGIYPDCAITGGSAISLEYDHGTDRDTLVKSDQYLAKLTYKY